MKNKIILFVFSIMLSFAFLDVSNAETKICQYELTSEHTTITVNIVDGKTEATANYVRETSNKDDRQLTVKNGQSGFEGTTFVADTYYKNNKKCPPHILLSKSNTGRYLFLSDESSISSLQKAIKNKYSTLDSGYPKKFPLKGSKEQKEDAKNWADTLSSSCMSFTTEEDCRRGYNKENDEMQFSCIWNENEFGNYCNVDQLVYVKCGTTFDIPYQAPRIISFVVYLLKIGTPIILIIFSIMQLVKALASSNEDELKKAQKVLVKKLIAAALVFFIISIVQFVIMKVADSSETNNISDCFDCFLNDNCNSSTYYKTNVGGTYLCKDFSSGKVYTCEGNK